LSKKRRATKRALLVVAAQFAYTSLFGAFASFLMTRTGNVCAPTAAHFFCNATGVPDVFAAARSRHRNVVFVAYAVGIMAFAANLGPLTDPARHPGSRWEDLVAVSASI
jgi:prenyl protein peptidase